MVWDFLSHRQGAGILGYCTARFILLICLDSQVYQENQLGLSEVPQLCQVVISCFFSWQPGSAEVRTAHCEENWIA